MSDCSDYPTLSDAKGFKTNADTINEVVTSDDDRTSPAIDGKTKKTLTGIEADATQQLQDIQERADEQYAEVADKYAIRNVGAYNTNPTINEYFEFVDYNGSPYFAVNPPYTVDSATYPDPSADSNLRLGSATDLSLVTASGSTTPRQLNERFSDTFNVKDYGALGDGVTDDTTAFQLVSDAINAAGGGCIEIPNGVYIVGRQVAGSSTYLTGEPIINISNCRSVVINGNGSRLKFNPSMKFGSFDPSTGDRYDPVMPFYDNSYRADMPIMIFADDCDLVSIKDLSMNGSLEDCDLGGLWGDTGRQCVAYGIRVRTCNKVEVSSVYAEKFPLDGFAFGWDGDNSKSNASITLINSSSDGNGRQGCSLTGISSMSVVGCSFSNTGKTQHSSGEVVSSAPASGFDIEAEGGSVNRNISFSGCLFDNNANTSVVADSGDSTDVSFSGCRFVSEDNIALWLNKPRVTVSDSVIVGRVVRSYPGTTFNRCLISDDFDGYQIVDSKKGGNLFDSDSQAVTFNSCTFDVRYSKLVMKQCIFNDCVIDARQGTDYFENRTWLFDMSSTSGVVEINQSLEGGDPTDGYYVITNHPNMNLKGNIDSGEFDVKLRWGSWASGAGTTGFMDSTVTTIKYNSRLRNDTYYGQSQIGSNNTEPTSGVYVRGDFIFNYSASTTNKIGWACTTGGTAGVDAVFTEKGTV